MSEYDYAVSRLRAWIRDYGHEKQPAFIADLETVLAAYDPAADLDRECKVAFAEMEIARHSGGMAHVTIKDAWIVRERFYSGERTLDLLTAMRELTGRRMQQSPTNG